MKTNYYSPRLRGRLAAGWLAAIFAVTLFLMPSALWAQEEIKPVKVPFELLKTQHMVVKAKVNGKGPYVLVFDTGAPITLLSNKVGKEGDVFGKDFKKPAFSLFGAMGQVKIKTLEVGDAKAEGVSAMVMDHPTIATMAQILKMPIEGIVGFPFFARYKMTIDYQAKELTLVPSKYEPPDMLESLMSGIMSGSAPKKTFLAPKALLGVKVTKEAADEEAGVTIQEVFAGSPAAAAGLKSGDRLLVLDGRWTDSVTDTFEAAATLRPGTEVRVLIRRKGKEETRTLKVQPGL
jgi:PDZ domain/Aspartyl protease